MVYLLLSIVCSAALVLMFKYFERSGTPVFQAIVVNYWVAAISGIIFLPEKQQLYNLSIFSLPWVPVSIVLGVMFISVFNLISSTTIRFGVSTASVASKLGLVFPVLLAFAWYGESFNSFKIVGIALAFVAVILSSLTENKPALNESKVSHAYLPFLVFIGSGACDAVTQYANKTYLMNTGMAEFALFIFLSAGTTGTLILAYRLVTGQSKLCAKSIGGGAVLGFINYFSFLFLLKALSAINWGSSIVFPLNNLGVVAFATVAGIILYKEKITKTNAIGLAFAAASIIVIVVSNS